MGVALVVGVAGAGDCGAVGVVHGSVYGFLCGVGILDD